MSNDFEVVVRDCHEGDAPYVFNTWIVSYYKNNKYNKMIDWEVYYPWMLKDIHRYFEAGARGLVAVSPDNPNQIFGFLVYTPQKDGSHIYHYAATKNYYKGIGIVRTLLKSTGWKAGMPIRVTHATTQLHQIKKDKQQKYPITLLPRK